MTRMQVYFELFYEIILLNIMIEAYKGFLNTTLDMKIKSRFHYDVFLHTKQAYFGLKQPRLTPKVGAVSKPQAKNSRNMTITA